MVTEPQQQQQQQQETEDMEFEFDIVRKIPVKVTYEDGEFFAWVLEEMHDGFNYRPYNKKARGLDRAGIEALAKKLARAVAKDL